MTSISGGALGRLLFEFRLDPPLLLAKLKMKALLLLDGPRLLRIENPCRPDRLGLPDEPLIDCRVLLSRSPEAPGHASGVSGVRLGFDNELLDVGERVGRKMRLIEIICSSSRQAIASASALPLLCCCLFSFSALFFSALLCFALLRFRRFR